MARVVFAIGEARRGQPVNITKRVRVAWCKVCRAPRILLNPEAWPDWPAGQAPVSGTCISCGSNVCIDRFDCTTHPCEYSCTSR